MMSHSVSKSFLLIHSTIPFPTPLIGNDRFQRWKVTQESPNRITQSLHSEGESISRSKMKHSLVSVALQRLIKSFAQLFAVQREEDEEVEMQIGFPTDVQHVTHIGFDGSNKIITTLNNWGEDPESLSLPALTLEELQLAMAVESDTTVADESLCQGEHGH